MKIENLKQLHEIVCNEYVKRFERKHGLNFEYWIADLVGETAAFGDYFFNMSEIIYDINTRQPKGLILKWSNDNVEYSESTHWINFTSYSKGLRHKGYK